MKRTLLAVTIATLGSASVQASPFLPMDARGLSMGNTGVASAKRAHAPAYNPSLLSQAEHDDDFAILFPQVGVTVADDNEVIDTFKDINDDLIPRFEDTLDSGNNDLGDKIQAVSDAANALAAAVPATADEINNAAATIAAIDSANKNLKAALADVETELTNVGSLTSELTNALSSVSGDQVRGRLGMASAIAIPSKSLAGAISFKTDLTFSGRTYFTSEDSALLNAYSAAGLELTNAADSLTDDIDTLLGNANNGTATLDQVLAADGAAQSLQNFTSGNVTTAGGDISIIENGTLSSDAEDAEMNSKLEIVAVAVGELGISLSREFTIMEKKVAVGITPKYQRIMTLHYITEVDNEDEIDEQDLEDSSETFNQFNLDVGASFRFGATNKWIVGVVGKNLLGGKFDTKDAEVRGSLTGETAAGPTIHLDPQFRAGVAFNGDWTTFALDVDLAENKPIAFEQPTQYVALGAEFDLFKTLQLRAGYRTNLSVADADVASIGLGLSPFGLHIDLALMANPNDPEKEIGAALETGFYF